MSKLNEEAINEINNLLKEVKDIVRLLKEFGITIDSDTWTASSLGGEGILHWKKEDFEKIIEINDGDYFYIGGNIITGAQHKYKDEWIIAPKKLAEVQGEIFEKYLKSIINSKSLKHYTLKIVDEYGLTDNCGWEHWICIKAIVKESALKKNKIKFEKPKTITCNGCVFLNVSEIHIDEIKINLINCSKTLLGTINKYKLKDCQIIEFGEEYAKFTSLKKIYNE